ncbi:hypothetical protein FRB99_003808 [Tulasnella sp. 403]|nr:hypothetical protein FRB99_003808 [Tulasnella sp. 403]
MSTLPTLQTALASPQALDDALSTLFEPSEVLTTMLVPQLLATASQSAPTTYTALIDLAEYHVNQWDTTARAQFIASHPRIGEVSGLSSLSAAEQATKTTPAAVLARLGHLNALYERRFPGLRYVVFVNGRSRAEIVPLVETTVGVGAAVPGGEREPALESIVPLAPEDEVWERELERALRDVFLIAKARLRVVGLEEGGN